MGHLTLKQLYGAMAPVSEVKAILDAMVPSKETVKDVASFAKKVEAAKKVAKLDTDNSERQNYWAELGIISARRLGQMIEAGQKDKWIAAHGGDRKSEKSRSDDLTLILTDIVANKEYARCCKQLASYSEKQIQKYIAECKAAGDEITKQGLVRIRTREAKERALAKLDEIAEKEPTPPDGKFDVVVIDPPWAMEKIEREAAPDQAAFDYPTMAQEELMELEIPCSKNCHVWLWTTHKFIPDAFDLLQSWGLKYVCVFVWHKPGGFQPFGLPQYNCEFALYARKGSPDFKSTKQFNTCFEAPRGEHSEKPEEFYEMVRRVTAGRRLDMFNRRKITGFTGWGNEAQ